MAAKPKMSKAEKLAAKAEKKKQDKHKRLWKLMDTGSALGAGILTARALDATWKTATGHPGPARAEHPDLGGREAIVWAAISGMAIGVAKTVATRRAAIYWVKSTGRLPPGMAPEAYRKVEQSTAS